MAGRLNKVLIFNVCGVAVQGSELSRLTNKNSTDLSCARGAACVLRYETSGSVHLHCTRRLAAMIKIARTVCQEACCHQRQGLIRRRPLRSYSVRASRSAQICSSVQHARTFRVARKVSELKTSPKSRGFACSAAVMEKESSTANPLLAVSTRSMSTCQKDNFFFVTHTAAHGLCRGSEPAFVLEHRLFS